MEHHLSIEFRCEKAIDRDVRNLRSGVDGPIAWQVVSDIWGGEFIRAVVE